MPIAGQLNAAGESARKVTNKLVSIGCIPLANMETWNQFRIWIHRKLLQQSGE